MRNFKFIFMVFETDLNFALDKYIMKVFSAN